MIQSTRIRSLNAMETRPGDYVLYWMQASQRAEYNHALEHAVRLANGLRRPVVVYFGLTADFPEANLRHYAFMLEGLAETGRRLSDRGMRLVVRECAPDAGAVELSRRAALAVVDRGYLRIQKDWRAKAARAMSCPLFQVESDAVVPVEEASPKEEYSAATLRIKISRKIKDYLVPLKARRPLKDSLSLDFESLDLGDIPGILSGLKIGRSVAPSLRFKGGPGEAGSRLKRFLKDRLDHFDQLRNDPTLDATSHLSPYLHFGQISPLFIALEASKKGGPGLASFLEELIVRRELGLNFVQYNPGYDSFDGLPFWARKTLAAHQDDERPASYGPDELAAAKTHDPYWNAAQREMTVAGKMHGYMRMYWGKKIIEWSRTPEEAFQTALALNNAYELDGRDPSGFAGVAWCFGKHDRPWGERSVFGNVRTMTDAGLRRKFDADRYVAQVAALPEAI
jgi:deoxyribodipyrimidine photo-lyase